MTSDLDRHALQRRTLIVLGAAQILSGFGLAAGITVGALLAAQLWGGTSVAGLPAVLFTVGAACASLVIARISTTRGRRPGLALGYLTGAIGGLGIIVAATNELPALLVAGFLVYGAGSAANLQARYAGADLAPPNMRARAMATVLMATTLGAVLGPLSAKRMGDLALSWGLDALIGPFILSTVAYLGGAIVLGVFLRPDPLLAARASLAVTAQPEVASGAPLSESPLSETPLPHKPLSQDPLPEPESTNWRRPVAWGVVVMVGAQVVMAGIMTMTPVSMAHHHHAVGSIGMVIALHVAAMYLPSPLSGYLVDKWGAWTVAGMSAAVLGLAGIAGALADPEGVVGTAFSLILLGLGWSFGMIAGSTIVTSHAPLALRPRVQGRSDALISLAGASGAGLSGVVVANAGYPALALGGAALAIALGTVAVAYGRGHRTGTISAS